MSKNTKVKIVIDLLMTFIFILLLDLDFVGIDVHEIIGVAILVIVIVHYVLNWNWVKGVFKATLNGKSKPKARLMLLLDVALGVFIVINIASGILISQTILRIFEVENIVLFSSIHVITSYITLFLLIVHIVLHIPVILHYVKRGLLNKENTGLRCVATVMCLVFTWVLVYNTANRKDTIFNNRPKQGEIDEQIEEQPIDNVDTPTLEEFLSILTCSGCGRRCSLLALQCGRGEEYKEQATIEFQQEYEQNNLRK